MALIVAPTVAAPPRTERFYLVVYAAQEETYHPEASHCFATFARIGRDPEIELRHINWFSAAGHRTGLTDGLCDSRGRPARPEPGENRTTREALALAARLGLRISRWGPYEIHQELYDRALQQIELLEGRVPGHRILYKACDLGYREGREPSALNCIHAISDIDRDPGPLRTYTSYGEAAACRVVLHLGRWVKDPAREHPDAWSRIWNATWKPDPAPELAVVRREPPFQRLAPAHAPGAELATRDP
jgi:hypothetical protein